MNNQLDHIEQIYFVGIGGIGMSALARYFHTRKRIVSGYDKTPGPITEQLIAESMQITYIDDPENLPDFIKNTDNKKRILIVYTPAIPKENKILNYFIREGYTMKKRAEVLGMLTKETFSICIAGTHGKTTTTSLLAHLMVECGLKPTVFAGGIIGNYQSNFINHPEGNISISEADEFDRSFLWLEPDMAVITSTDADHLDIYGDSTHFLEGFKAFSEKIKPGGKLLVSEEASASIQVPHETYGLTEDSMHHAHFIGVNQGYFEFEVRSPLTSIQGIYHLPIAGLHNIKNALAATVLAGYKGCAHPEMAMALKGFKGVKRRFESIVQNEKIAYIDDYAHHPTEIKAAISAARLLYPDKKLSVIFQPHLYSRTRDFMEAFAAELSKADQLILLDIYPAREEPIEGISSSALLQICSNPSKIRLSKEELIPFLEAQKTEIELLMTLGAGDIDRFVEPIKNLLISHE